jgi:hypothetical protein
MSLVDRVLLQRAEEQMVHAWRKTTYKEALEEREHLGDPPCELCGSPAVYDKAHKPKDGGAWLCKRHRGQGYRSTRCHCGHPLHYRDYASPGRSATERETMCGGCRERYREWKHSERGSAFERDPYTPRYVK